MKKVKFLYIIFLLIFFIFNSKKIPDTYQLNFENENNLRQTYNDCGPYNCYAVLKVLKNERADINKIKNEMSWRLKNNYTVPWGLEKLLKSYNIKIKTPNFKKLSDIDKINFLKKELSNGNPIIILGGTKTYQHYITILGYDEKSFYIYDSIQKKDENNPKYTIDDNGIKSGNKYLTYNELLTFWSYGGKYNLFEYYGLICKK